LTKVFLTGGDGVGWALDNDLALTRAALERRIEPCGLAECEVVHSMWWAALADIPARALAGKRVICHMAAEPLRCLCVNGYSETAARVGLWIAQSRQALGQLESMGRRSVLVPYTVDTNVFRPLPDREGLRALRRRWGIPPGAYVLANFHRDTEGGDLRSPKLVKGPDVLAEIAKALASKGHPVHVLLAGPRRHWLRRRLAEAGVPFSFAGADPGGMDDLGVNTLPRDELNALYNVADVCVVCSRSEGGPRSVLEAAAAGRKVVSTRVGLAPDVLEERCLYSAAGEAIRLLERDIREGFLDGTAKPQQERVLLGHQPSRAAALFRDVYARLEGIEPFLRPKGARIAAAARPASLVSRAWRRLTGAREPLLTAGLWHKFVEPPFGGGNQFMLALRKYLRRLGARVVDNDAGPGVHACVLNSIRFDADRLRARLASGARVVHRIDGPISLIRGSGREDDDRCFRLNSEFATATVLQSAWNYARLREMGYAPVDPVIVRNAVDPEIFNRDGRSRFDPGRKIRLISTSWSGNPRKGGPVYKWIEDRLDWSRYEYTFVGQCSERLERIRHIPPVPSEKLAGILRGHDIYITASASDPCSNALLEALACGLPALYLKDGGHPELAGQGGLPFERNDEIFPQLERLVEDYGTFQSLIATPSMDQVARQYLELLAGPERAGACRRP